MKQDLSGFAAASLLAAIVFGVSAYGDYRNRPKAKSPDELSQEAREARETADAAAADAILAAQMPYAPSRFTPAGFSNYVTGLTKTQVRAQFGSPDQLTNGGNGWFYYQLPIYDPDAGIQVAVTVQFAGFGGPDDEVLEVRY